MPVRSRPSLPVSRGSQRRPQPQRRRSAYREALAVPGARRFFVAAGIARVGIAMTGLGLVWLIHSATGSYGDAGLVTGGFALAEAAGGPQVARVIDRYGQTRILPVALAAHGTAGTLLVLCAVYRAPTGLLVAGGVLAGASIPQVGALSSARWANLLGGTPLLHTAFALESVTNAVAFLVGPTLVGTVAALISPVAASVLATALVLAGGFALVAMTSTAPPVARPASTSTGSPRLLTRAFAVLVVLNATLGALFGTLGVAVTAFALDHHAARLAGPLNSIGSVAGLAAVILYGRRSRPSPAEVQVRRAGWVLAAATLPLLAATSVATLAGALVLPGLVIAPTLVLSTVRTQALVDGAVLTQAFTWLNSASAAGYAGGAALSGVLADAFGTRSSFALASAAAVAGAVAVTATSRADRAGAVRP